MYYYCNNEYIITFYYYNAEPIIKYHYQVYNT